MMRNKRRHKRKNSLGRKMKKWFSNLSKPKKAALIAVICFLVLVIFLVFYVISKYNRMNIEEIPEDEIIINEEVQDEEFDLGDGYTNFVLFGGDSRTGEVEKNLNTDSIIIVSLNNETKEIKMVSVYRDTLLDISKGTIRKCNSAYSVGGPKNAINMLNRNLDLDIMNYVTVDFGAVAEVIDMIGGVEIDVSEAEMRACNDYIGETAMVAKKEAKLLKKSGLQTLDGVQATTYARIRKGVGDDYSRTEQHRHGIKK